MNGCLFASFGNYLGLFSNARAEFASTAEGLPSPLASRFSLHHAFTPFPSSGPWEACWNWLCSRLRVFYLIRMGILDAQTKDKVKGWYDESA